MVRFGDAPAPSRRHANAGTVLADTEQWGRMLDTVTILQMLLFPDDTVSVPLTTVVETVKHLGTGINGGLDGLRRWCPVRRGCRGWPRRP